MMDLLGLREKRGKKAKLASARPMQSGTRKSPSVHQTLPSDLASFIHIPRRKKLNQFLKKKREYFRK
jgi:hypothetical protein